MNHQHCANSVMTLDVARFLSKPKHWAMSIFVPGSELVKKCRESYSFTTARLQRHRERRYRYDDDRGPVQEACGPQEMVRDFGRIHLLHLERAAMRDPNHEIDRKAMGRRARLKSVIRICAIPPLGPRA